MGKEKILKKIFNRYMVLVVIMLTLFSILGLRLYNLQIANGQYYSDTANTKAHKNIEIEAPRGLITDKNGIQLATEVQSYNLTYTDTTEANKKLFPTLQKVFKILDDNGEAQTDSFPLKIAPYRFEFSASDPKEIQKMQLRFLKDRNFQQSILKKNFKNKKEADLTKAETKALNNQLLKLKPEMIYNELVKNYDVIKDISSLKTLANPDLIRRYLIVQDGIKQNDFSGYKSVSIAENIKKNTSLIFKQSLSELPGMNVENQPRRQYPYGELASSVLGYISKINPDDQEKYLEKGYDTSTDYVGASGIEAAMESELKGTNGGDVVQVDKQGRVKTELASRQASPGKNVQLTIDANLQYATENALDSKMKELQKRTGGDVDVSNATRGAAVAIDIHTGGILALSTNPGFNPNDFSNSQGLTEAQTEKYFNPDYESMAKNLKISQSEIDRRFPIDTSIKGNSTIRKDRFDYFPKYLYDYATMSLIPSGSTFKPMAAIAGLQSGAIDASTILNDQAIFDMGGTNNILHFRTEAANGPVDVVKALEVSSNPFFMNVGKQLRAKGGDDLLAKYAWGFGLGADPSQANPGTGIEINENFGQVYNTASQKNNSAKQSLLNIEQDLTNGVSGTSVKLPQIDLYDRDGDIKTVSKIKTEIKTDIKDSVKNGTFSKSNYESLFKQLIDTDPRYKGKNITTGELQSIANDVNYQAVQQGHGTLSLPFNIYEASIGQGMDNFTPLQMANYVATIANGGTRNKLHLVDNIKDSDGKVVSQSKPVVLDKADMSSATQNKVMEGMNAVTGSTGGATDGTAYEALGSFPIKTGGKTGTAQVSDDQSKNGRSDYAWFIGYAPAENPQIAVAVVIFDGGYGKDSAFVAKGMYESYFKNDPKMANYVDTEDINLKPIVH